LKTTRDVERNWEKDYIEKIEKGQWKYVMRVLATGIFNMRIVDG